MQLNASSITGPLALGSRGPDVRTLQAALNRTIPSLNLQVDGAFGMKTDAAVRAFQQSKTLKRDGIVGPRTAAALGLRYTAQAPLPAPPLPSPQPPGRPRRHHETPVLPGPPDSSAIAQLVEAVIQGVSEVHNGVLRMIQALEDLPDIVLNEIRGLVTGAFQAAVATLRECIRIAQASPAAAAAVVGNAIRAAFQKLIAALQAILGVLRRLPDLLGLTGVANKIQLIITKLQKAVEAVIDVIIRTLSGLGRSVAEAVPVILAAVREAAAAAA